MNNLNLLPNNILTRLHQEWKKISKQSLLVFKLGKNFNMHIIMFTFNPPMRMHGVNKDSFKLMIFVQKVWVIILIKIKL